MMPRRYQRPERTVNATTGKGGRPRAGAILACLALISSAAFSAPETIRLQSGDGLSVSALHYRPADASSRGAVLFPDGLDGPAGWQPLAEPLAAAGWHVLVPEVDTGPEEGTVGGPLGWGDPAEPVPSGTGEASSAMRFLGDQGVSRIVWGGAGGAATAVALAAARHGAAAILLVSPAAEEGASIPLPPGVPTLLVAAREDLAGSETAIDLLLGDRSSRRYWELEGSARGGALLRGGQGRLRAALIDWFAQLGAALRPPAQEGEARGR